MKRILLCCCVVIAAIHFSWSQDQHFTQFYASPLTLNPGLTGAFDGKYRVSMIYRDQWRGALENPYKTVSAAIDLRFGISSYKKPVRDAVGAGVLFYSDNVPGINFSTNQMIVSGAFHKSLSRRNDQFLSLGGQAGIAQRNITYEQLTFDDQFNGTTGYFDPTAESFPENNFAFSDFAVGLNYSYAPYRKMGFFLGFALHHILEPQVTFYQGEDQLDPNLIGDNRLLQKYTGHISFQIPLSETVDLLPRGLVYIQGPHFAINAGTNVRFLFNDSKGMAFHIGSWLRPVSDEKDEFFLDAVIGMVGIEINNFLVGFSYDANLTQLNLGRNSQGAFEISIAYLGQYDNELIQCPKF